MNTRTKLKSWLNFPYSLLQGYLSGILGISYFLHERVHSQKSLMETLQRSPGDRNTQQAINSLKKGSYLLKYGRWGKPKFCPFQLSKDETTLIWYAGKDQKQLQLNQVSRIIPGQRTPIFQRFPQPEKEYQSFSLLYGKKSLDVICKDKYEAEIWFVALRALISRGNCQKWRTEIRTEDASSDSSSDRTERNSLSVLSLSSSDAIREDKQIDQIIDAPLEGLPQKSLGRAFSDILLHKAVLLGSPQRDCVHCSSISQPTEISRISEDTLRASYSSTITTTSSVESSTGDAPLSSIFVWGEGFDDGEPFPEKDAFIPKLLESASALDCETIACGSTHAMLVTRQGQVFSWGDGSGGKLGHGLDADICRPKLIDSLGGLNVVSVGCGEYHTCAVTQTGDLYTWGDGIHNVGLLGHGTEFSYWTPRKVRGEMEGIHVTSVSCGPWHSAAITSQGQLFTFGEGTFGALGHGDRCSTKFPREIEAFKGQIVLKVSCGFWHTAAIVEFPSESPTCGNSLRGKLFTWGNGDEGQLGLGDELSRLTPNCVSTPNDTSFSQVACGHSITVALTICGKVYTLGVTDRGELKRPGNSHMLPTQVESKLKNFFVKEIACGSHHVAAVTSTSETFTWGKGRNGQLGHGDNADRYFPTLVKALEGKHVKRITCGNNYTVAICLHQWVRSSDYSVCSGCQHPFNFKRKRHNCYNCGLLFCNDCTSKRSLHASLAPNLNRSYRVCDDCYSKLNKGLNSRIISLPPRSKSISLHGNITKEKKKDPFKAPQRSVLCKLASFDPLIKAKKEVGKKSEKVDTSSSHNSPIHGGTTGYDGSLASSPSTSIIDGCDRINAPLPCSTSSPVSTKSTNSPLLHSSFHYHPFQEEVVGDQKHINDDLAEEISFLKAQVESLVRKSQLLSAELERTSSQLDEATAWFQQEFEKNNAAKEAIKRLMSQMKDMASAKPQAASCRTFADNNRHVLSTAST